MHLLISFAAVPGPPAAPEVSNVLSTSCRVSYQLPVDEGDAPVTGYHVQRRAGGGAEWITVNTSPITELEFVVDHLTPHSRYEFRVAASNRIGIGDFGSSSQPITTNNSVRNMLIRDHSCL